MSDQPGVRRGYPHGTRRCYQADGCTCPPCRAANAAYSAEYRSAIRSGRPPLGARVVGTEAARVITTLLEEDYTKAQIATWLGHRWPVLHWRAGDGVTLRTTLRLRALQRRVCG